MDSNIQKRGIPLVSRCVCCNTSKVETLDHLMVKSDITRTLWDQFATKLNKANQVRSIAHLREVWLHEVNRRSQVGLITIAIVFYGIWEIWKIRCRMKFEEERVDLNQLMRRMYNHIHDIFRIHRPIREPTTMDKIFLEGLNCNVRRVGVKKGRWLAW